MNVLLIDDSNLMRERLRHALQTIEQVRIVGEAASLIQAKTLLQETRPDVVFLDIRLSDGVSIDYIRKIKQMEPCPKVVVFTNYPYPQYRDRCLEEGADYFLEKKTDFSRISEIMRELIG